MTDISITPANVLAGSGADIERGKAGANITAGQVVYRDGAGKYQLADADGATAAAKAPRGIALHSAAANQPLSILRRGPITIGATVVAGTAYYLSPTPGGIAPLADIQVGDDYVLIGLAKSASVIEVDFQIPGVTRQS